MADLTAKQARFVDAYLVDCNGTQAAIAAGYSQVSARVGAHRLLTKPAVRAAIAARQGVDSQRLQLGRQEALEGLLQAVQQARALGDPMAMIAGWREIGRMMGFYAPERRQVEVSAAAEGEMGRLERLSDDELLKLMAAG